jgi:serine acetyltransferase
MKIIKELLSLRGNTKGLIFIFLFRVSSFFTSNSIFKVIGLPFRLFYKLFVQWILGIDIPDVTKIGFGFNLFHGQGVVINEATIIGSHVKIRQNTTIGNSKDGGGSPVIGNNVDIGASSVIIGSIKIGDNCKVGAGSIVVKSFPASVVIAGNPAKIIKRL